MRCLWADVTAVTNINNIKINSYGMVRQRCSRQALLQIPGKLHRLARLDDLLGYISRLSRVWLRGDGAAVILLDPDAKSLIVEWASHVDPAVGLRVKRLRFPAEQGAAGQVCRSGKALIVEDYVRSRYASAFIEASCGFVQRNLLLVPLRMQDRILGVLCVADKRKGRFDSQDMDLLGAIADVAAWPIETVRVTAAMRASLEQVRQLRSARELVIHHLSHELKTPLAVLSASIALLLRRSDGSVDPGRQAIDERIERNLQRLLDMEYKLEDMLRDQET
jgi:GAF domain-containing protein